MKNNIEHKIRVLIIEDNTADQIIFKNYLKQSEISFHVQFAQNIAEALKKIDKSTVDVLLLSLNASKNQTIDMLVKIREIAPDIPIIVISEHEDEFLVEQLIKKGAQDFLNKKELDSKLLIHSLCLSIKRVKYQKENQESLQLKEKATQISIYIRNLIEAEVDPLFVLSPDGIILDTNKAAQLITGYSREKLINSNFADYFTDPERAINVYKKTLEFGILKNYNLEISHREGRLTPVMINASVYRNEEDKVVGVVVLARDITELMHIQEELEKSNKDLEQFAYVASHDLQEPLRMISSFTQLLEKRYKDKLDTDANEFIYYIVDGVSRMQSLINDLLTYSRVARTPLKFTQVDCEEVIDNVLTNLQVMINENNAVITHDPLPTVTGDALQLTQLFQNLISNAIKFHGQQAPHVHISAEQKGDMWLFSVKDNGIGIPAQYFDRIFTIFQRLHTRRKYTGTGIGLSVCKKVVERHGGKIWLASEEGKGTTFFSQYQKRRGKTMAEKFIGQIIDILLIEDNPGDILLTKEALKESKVRNRLNVVEDGEQAMSFLRQEGEYINAPRPDLILLDLNLPKKDGLQVLAEMKQDPELKMIPVVVMTTSEAEEDILRSYNLHANAYVTKPLDLGKFIKIVKSIEDFWLGIVKLPPKEIT